MKMLIAFVACVGTGYAAEVHFENPNEYVVWLGFTVISFGAYCYLTQITSFAFVFPVAATIVATASVYAYIESEPGIIVLGVYATIGVLIVLGDRFLNWRWADWKTPTKLINLLGTNHSKT